MNVLTNGLGVGVLGKIRILAASALILIGALVSVGAVEKISIGYVPNMAFAQLFVIAGEGWDKEAGVELAPLRFADASMSIQAFGKGEIDVMYTIITSGLIARSKGLDLEVVAVATKNSNEFLGKGRLAELAKQMPLAQAIKKLQVERNGPVKILNFYRGSISDTVLRRWLTRQKELVASDYAINNVAGQFQFTQAMLTADYDAVSTYEPLISIARGKGLKLESLLKPEEMLKDHPTAVLAVRGQWAKKNPQAVRKLVELHCRATQLLHENPAQCVPHLQKFVSGGMLTNELVKTATDRVLDTFVANPVQIMVAADILQQFLLEQKLMDKTVDLKAFIDTSYYDSVKPGLKHAY